MSEEATKSEWRFKVLTLSRTVTRELHGTVVIRVLVDGEQDFDGDTPEGEALVQLLDENELIKWSEDSDWDDHDLSVIDVDECDTKPATGWACDCRLNDDGEWEID
jgi:hypothetical protein